MKKTALTIGSMIAGGIVSTAGFTRVTKAKPPAEKTSTVGRRILLWHDPMYPNTQFDKPGKSPSVGMDLVLKYADERSFASGVRINPTQTQNLGVKTAIITRGPLTFAQSSPANVNYNEYQCAIVQTHAVGFINRVYPLTVGDKVQKDIPLLNLTTPDWVETQSEYSLPCETGGTTTQTEDTLERLRLAGVPEVGIRRLITTQKVQTRFMFKAPIGGVITASDLCMGMNIAKDSVIAKVQGVDPVRVTAAIPESIAWLVKDASQFALTVSMRPDKTLTVREWTLLSGVDATTRMLQLRLEANNADRALKPGMSIWLQLNTASGPILLIPSQALTDTGSEQRVITVDADGHFVLKRVAAFQTSQGVTALCSSLAEDEKVVSSGLFLIDSEANISGTLERMRSESVTHAY